jgi:pyruvate kinase
VDGPEILTTLIEGGTLGEHKGISAPGVTLPASAVTAKDIDDLRFGLSLGVDLVAVSFVQTGDDIRRVRQLIVDAGGTASDGSDVPVVAKLERPRALDHLDDILDASDAVMVARGDLGLEMPLEAVPHAQKDITRRARQKKTPVILATQVLESMTTEPRPTRAEVSDAANAVEDGVDAIMLAGETAAGAFPARAVQTLDAVIRDAEASLWQESPVRLRARAEQGHDHAQALCEAAVTLAERGEAPSSRSPAAAGRRAVSPRCGRGCPSWPRPIARKPPAGSLYTGAFSRSAPTSARTSTPPARRSPSSWSRAVWSQREPPSCSPAFTPISAASTRTI